MQDWYLRNPLTHENRRRGAAGTPWERSFACPGLRPLIICRGPIRIEAMNVFEEMDITGYGMLLSERDSITYPNALSPELRKQIHPDRVHRVTDYSGATREERKARIRQIVGIARRNGYNAVFAGYGFMAEDEELVLGLEAAGLNFIGPCSSTIRQAGRKDLAKRTALEVGVSVTPGVDNATVLTLLSKQGDAAALSALVEAHDLDVNLGQHVDLADAAEAVLNASYDKGIDLITADEVAATLTRQIHRMFSDSPGDRIRLKAIGGGGGKGQRILNCPDQFEGSLEQRIEAAAAQVAPLYREVLAEVKAGGVGDNKNVLAELNIETVRHQEIQVVGNGQWCITMGGRDCSLQNNEQKLLEISVTEEELTQAIEVAEQQGAGSQQRVAALRTDLEILRRMESEAARFGAAVGLDSVSTFECIVDRDRHFFMEMNTRVQVEHRVTELCYGLKFVNPENVSESFTVHSIVELMVLLAVHGERLPKPERVPRQGVAVEVRLNATDGALKPHAGGMVTDWSPAIDHEIRDDQGICLHNPDTDVFMKYHLAGAYDSNIALLLTTGDDRRECFARMAEILRRTRLGGVNLETNLQFQYGLLCWIMGQDIQARPATSLVGHYLTAVGQLCQEAGNLDIVAAWDRISRHYRTTLGQGAAPAVTAIMDRKASLMARAINALFAEPHFLAGWLSVNRRHFDFTDAGGDDASGAGICWQTNPVVVLRDLYHYLNMDDSGGQPALYVIWDHDQELLADALAFYETVCERLDTDDWSEVTAALADGGQAFGADAEAVQAAHQGYQLGMEILAVLPYVGKKSGFLDLVVNPDLSVAVPERLRDSETRQASMKALSPPPPASGNEILAPSGGMYYSREAPDRDTFVNVGDHFEKGDPLFIIEVMKMFNKVYAPFSGTVDAVMVDTDATIIKRGDVVLGVTPDDDAAPESGADAAARIRQGTEQFLRFVGMPDK
ncbi:MAG: biotin carboxylase [Proteobacteria bacterium]|nr:biotin carboxylase [Pseudomonadota bacterium]MDA1299239.1 biotin carboxylase [Pseudomonadota bacterium]